MSAAPANRADWRGAVAALLASTPLGGCFVYHAAKVPVNVAVDTVEVAGGVAIGTAKIAGSAIGLAASLAQTGVVTFVDVASGTVTRVPWRDGLTLASAGDAAKLQLANHAVDVVRAGKVAYAASGPGIDAARVASGDVVRVGK